jgi:hypothetical protein
VLLVLHDHAQTDGLACFVHSSKCLWSGFGYDTGDDTAPCEYKEPI